MADSFLDIFLDDFVEEEQDNPDDDLLGLCSDDDQQEPVEKNCRLIAIFGGINAEYRTRYFAAHRRI